MTIPNLCRHALLLDGIEQVKIAPLLSNK